MTERKAGKVPIYQVQYYNTITPTLSNKAFSLQTINVKFKQELIKMVIYFVGTGKKINKKII